VWDLDDIQFGYAIDLVCAKASLERAQNPAGMYGEDGIEVIRAAAPSPMVDDEIWLDAECRMKGVPTRHP